MVDDLNRAVTEIEDAVKLDVKPFEKHFKIAILRPQGRIGMPGFQLRFEYDFITPLQNRRLLIVVPNLGNRVGGRIVADMFERQAFFVVYSNQQSVSQQSAIGRLAP